MDGKQVPSGVDYSKFAPYLIGETQIIRRELNTVIQERDELKEELNYVKEELLKIKEMLNI